MRRQARIARRLDELGVAFIEGGWPGSNPKDAEFFAARPRHPVEDARSSPPSAPPAASGARPRTTPTSSALLDAQTPVCTVVGKTWTLHVTEVLRTTLDENLRMIEESVAYLRAQGRRVIYDAEHFFDGYRADPAYALETLRAAVRGGAETLVLCDTNGGSLPWEVAEIVRGGEGRARAPARHPRPQRRASARWPTRSRPSREGAIQVQGTINGYGERCGNANLCSHHPQPGAEAGLRCLPEGRLRDALRAVPLRGRGGQPRPRRAPRLRGQVAPSPTRAASTSRPCGGTPTSYQHIDPALVGNQMRVVVSELSGRGNLLSKAEEYGAGRRQRAPT